MGAYLNSLAIGGLLAAGIIGLNAIYPAEPFKLQSVMETEAQKAVDESNKSGDSGFGKSGSRGAKEEAIGIHKLQAHGDSSESLAWFSCIQWVFFFLVIIGCTYALNAASKGEFLAALVAMFPREFAILGFR